ncbi:MAG: glycoside hydrolase family protein [Sulfuricurvum sp.]|jgi:lysozyme|uniref:glycoside hydrolase family protein n=1 Tax=Sulfuricurvum sp. TaxID=2025608 RepID=UPI0025FE13F6|nr:glycoside hydrolase family protein [Sulfuricurvum sp.]MCK9373453.1 glycoside hydrolase family protein [Sulfuricurvum sp.]
MTKLEEQLIIDEGFSSKPYKDTVGKLTIGFGRNLDDKGISRSEAFTMLQTDIKAAKYDLSRNLKFFDQLCDGRQSALINMTFNMGIDKVLGFKRTLKLMEEGKFEEASIEVLKSKWAEQVGDRAKRISDKIRLGY